MRIFFLRNLIINIFITLLLVCGVGQRWASSQNQTAQDREQLDFSHGLFQRGFYEMAVTEYAKFIALFHQSPYLEEANLGIAESFFSAKDYEKSSEAYRTYIQLYPNGGKLELSKLRLGQCAFFLNYFDEALIHFNSVKGDQLEDLQKQALFFYSGKAYRQKGDPEKAQEFFDKILAAFNQGEYVTYALLENGDISAQQTKYMKAFEYFEKAENSTDSEETQSLSIQRQGEMQFLLGNYSLSVDTFKRILEKYSGKTVAQDALINLLLAYFNLAKYEELIGAFNTYQNLLHEEPRSLDAYFVTASAYAQLVKTDESIAILDKILALSFLNEENKFKALIKKVDIYINAGRFDTAIALIGDVLEKVYPESEHVLFLKAEALYGVKKFSEAYELYKKVFIEYPASSFSLDSLYGMAYSQNAQAHIQEALDLFFEYFQKGKEEAKRREALYNEILLSDKLNDLKRAVDHSEMYLATFTEGDQAESVLFRLGGLYSTIENYNKAVEIFKQFIQQYPQSQKLPEVYFQLAYSLQLLENYDESITLYEKIIGNKPQKDEKNLYYASLKNLAFVFVKINKTDEAVKMIEMAISEYINNDLDIETYLWLAESYINQQRLDDTLNILQKAESLENGSIRKSEIAYFRAVAYREKKDFKAAVEHYNVVLSEEKNKYGGAARIGKGVCLIKLGQLDEAKIQFETAMQENAEDYTLGMRARFEVANLEYERNHLEEASKYYMLVAILYKDDYYCPEALYRAGKIFEFLKRNDEAKKVYQEIIDSYEKSHVTNVAKERMAVLSAS